MASPNPRLSLAFAAPNLATLALGTLPGPNSAISRTELYGQVWRLAQATPFTGGGLAADGSRWLAADLDSQTVAAGTKLTLNTVNTLDQADIFHSPFVALPERPQRRQRARRFLTVHDITPLLFPQFYAFGEDALLRSILASIGPEDHVLCVSESCRQDLCDTLEIDPARVFVSYNAADASLFYPCWDGERGDFEAGVIDVLTLRGDRIAEVTAFLGGERFPRFGLPERLPA